jgi:hypothetical protein
MAQIMVQQKAHIEASYPYQNYLSSEDLDGDLKSRKQRAQTQPIYYKTTIPKLYQPYCRLQSGCVVESTEDLEPPSSKITKPSDGEDS